MTTTAKRATFLASLGAGLEYYDFIIYGMMAGTLSTLFFANDVPWIATMKSFGVFSVGYLARPLGGIFFGTLGDTFGRKKVFVRVMLLMALSTFMIGLLPTYSTIGGAAAFLLLILRLLQGFSFGAELPGAITVVCEYTKKKSHGSYSSFVISSVGLGSMLASLVLYLVTTYFSTDELLSFAWRIPFLLGGTLALANFFIRRQLSETPEFLENEKQNKDFNKRLKLPKTPLKQLLKTKLLDVVLAIGMTIFLSSLIIFVLYLPTYLSEYYKYQSSAVYLAMTYGLIWSALTMPIFGLLSDKIGKIPLYMTTSVLFSLVAFPLFGMLNAGGFARLVVFMCLYQTVISLITVCYFPTIVALFPIEMRYTGIATSYNISYALMGSVPLIVTTLIQVTGDPASAIWFLIGCGFCGGISCFFIGKRLTEEYYSQI